MRTRMSALIRLAGVAAIVSGLLTGARSARAATPTICSRYDIESLTVGSPLGYVRSRFGRESLTTNLVRPGQHDTTAVDYVIRGRAIYVEYDHRIDRKPEAKIAVLRASVPSTEDAVQDIVRHFGTPTVSPERKPDGDGQLPPPDGFVWVDPSCGIVATIYRRAGSWWSGDVGTFLQLEAVDTVRQGTSAALPYLQGTSALAALTTPPQGAAPASDDAPAPAPVADGNKVAEASPPPPAAITLPTAAAAAHHATEIAPETPSAEALKSAPPPSSAAQRAQPPPVTTKPGTQVQETPPPQPSVESLKPEPPAAEEPESAPARPSVKFAPYVDTAPQRIASPPPAYPANLRMMGVTGRVSLVAVVRIDGTIGDVRVVKAEPSGRGFEQAATTGVKRWRYKPATLRGVPTESEVEVNIEFK